jgi:hypothetical protein
MSARVQPVLSPRSQRVEAALHRENRAWQLWWQGRTPLVSDLDWIAHHVRDCEDQARATLVATTDAERRLQNQAGALLQQYRELELVTRRIEALTPLGDPQDSGAHLVALAAMRLLLLPRTAPPCRLLEARSVLVDLEGQGLLLRAQPPAHRPALLHRTCALQQRAVDMAHGARDRLTDRTAPVTRGWVRQLQMLQALTEGRSYLVLMPESVDMIVEVLRRHQGSVGAPAGWRDAVTALLPGLVTIAERARELRASASEAHFAHDLRVALQRQLEDCRARQRSRDRSEDRLALRVLLWRMADTGRQLQRALRAGRPWAIPLWKVWIESERALAEHVARSLLSAGPQLDAEAGSR